MALLRDTKYRGKVVLLFALFLRFLLKAKIRRCKPGREKGSDKNILE